MKTSNIIGTLSGVYSKVIVDGEVFYETNLKVEDAWYPARLPEYVGEVARGKYKLSCFLATDRQGEKLHTFVSVITADFLENQKTQDCNTFSVGGLVHKNGGLIPIPSRGTVSIALVISSSSGVENVKFNSVHVTAVDKIARELVSVPKGAILELNGYLKMRRGCIYMHATEIALKKVKSK